MKSTIRLATALIGVSLFATSGALAAPSCAHNPNALGTSRTITVSPAEFPLVGKEQYLETLPLRDREVVLTFDDGPIPATTPRILETLAAECVKATFFMLGMNVAEAPNLARRAYDEGHTIGTHTFSHPTIAKVSSAKAKQDINLGIEALTEGLGRTRRLAPFFRPPYLSITKDIERYLLSRGQMVWSIDADSLDWTFTTADKMVERSIAELERVGKGILLLHDIKPVTVRALPNLLAQLKLKGFSVVHVVPAPLIQSTSIAPVH
ncbi:MAG: polysaccharide deacetylase family protein [Rhizobiales bacterium]|nr:polysaccharide deacetylase family protein [Hyphomicrobiales bacterium]